jgi:hypothetical protein
MGGASLLGGALGGKGASKAAKAQTQASDAAIAEQRREYDLGRADLAPYRDAGGQAIGMGFDMLQPGYDYTASPGYDFRLSEGLRGVENSAAAKGLLQSGGTLKGIDRYAEGLAAQDFNDQFNRAMAVAGGGQQAATSSANLGQQTGANIGNLLMQQGNAKASGYAGQNQAIQGTIGNLMSLYGMGAFGGLGGSTGGMSQGLSDVYAGGGFTGF